MSEKTKKILKFIGSVAGFCFLLFFMLKVAHAQDSLGGGWDKFLKGDLPGFNAPKGATGEDIAAGVVRRGITLVKYLVGSAALIFGIIYAVNLIVARGKEEALTKNKLNFLWLFIGFIIIMVADGIANIFNPEAAKSDALIDFQAARDQLRDVANYLKWVFGSVIVLFMTIAGVRLITAGGNQETIEKEKRHLVWSGIGMLMILLATNLVNAIYVVNKVTGETTAANASVGIDEVGGIIKLILVFLGPMAVVFTIYAGIMYLTALDNEDRANKAKKMIVAGVTGIIIIYSAFALANTFLTADLVPPENIIAPNP